jgi:hypothetical protein
MLKELKELVDAGGNITQGEWYIRRELIDIDYYSLVTSRDLHESLILFGYDNNYGYINYSDEDAKFVCQAANSRPALSALLKKLESVDVVELEDALSHSVFVQNGCEPIMQAARTLLEIVRGE